MANGKSGKVTMDMTSTPIGGSIGYERLSAPHLASLRRVRPPSCEPVSPRGIEAPSEVPPGRYRLNLIRCRHRCDAVLPVLSGESQPLALSMRTFQWRADRLR